MKAKLGLPYKGSKRAIASSLIDAILFYKPTAKYFVDLFGGGGAMSLEALRKRRFLKVFYNEINAEVGCLFEACIDGSLQDKIGDNYLKFFNRSEFYEIKDRDDLLASFVKTIFSFGNARNNYLYSQEIEHWKEKAHNFIVNLDASGLDWFIEQTGCVGLRGLTDIFKPLNWKQRRKIWVDVMLKVEAIKVSGLGDYDNYFYRMRAEDLMGISQASLSNLIAEKCDGLETKTYRNADGELYDRKRIDKIKLDYFNGVDHLNRIQHLECLEGLEGVACSNSCYKDFKISTPIEETIIYCDPPYMNTSGYHNDFDSLEFFEWAKKHDYGIFISEYSNPLGLEQVLSLGKRELLSIKNNKRQEFLLWNGK